ncbi:MAG TPA: DNA repair and recombination protein RadB [Candidatus Nanoarchaeia archaeon]|nr:DNA repair and recombination protein RadB [Candidatus Nanoarchaeia archaeon]
MEKISTGAVFLDKLLEGGYEKGIVTTLYGPSGTGKTNFCLLAASKIAASGKKVLFVDTEGGIAVERIKQLNGINSNYLALLDQILFFNPVNFAEQIEAFGQLKALVNGQAGLIVIDSISMLYRLELGKNEEVYEVNSALGQQIGGLVEIARRHNLPVLITNQVYTDFDNRNKVKMVGGDLLKYGSKCILELQKTDLQRILLLRKHRFLPESKEIIFKIVEQGIEEA